MTIHKYTCKECDEKPFYTTFEPLFDDPAFCPCCGKDYMITYHGEIHLMEVMNRESRQSEVA